MTPEEVREQTRKSLSIYEENRAPRRWPKRRPAPEPEDRKREQPSLFEEPE